MIWLLFGALLLAVILYVCAPLYRRAGYEGDVREEVKTYTQELDRIETLIEAGEDTAGDLARRKATLEKQLAEGAGRGFKSDALPSPVWLMSVFLLFGFGAVGLYSTLGRPDLAGPMPATPDVRVSAAETDMSQMSVVQLTERLKANLDENPDRPDGWMLYARSLMGQGRYDEAFAAYEKVLSLTDNHPNVAEELARARAYAAGQTQPFSGPSAEDIEAAQTLSAEDRSAMIHNMVQGLAARLKEEPNDPQGWVRLLRSRQVLGQTAELETEIAQMKTVFTDQPDVSARILKEAGIE